MCNVKFHIFVKKGTTMENSIIHKAVGEITRGGFSSLINLVEDGSIVIMHKFNEPVAVVMRADRNQIKLIESGVAFGQVVAEFAKQNMPSELESYLVSQVIMGVQAEALLVSVVGQEKVNDVKNKLLSNYEKNYTEEVVNAGEQTIAPCNEEEGMQSVSPTLFHESNQTSSAKRKTPPQRGVRKVKTGVKK